MLAPMASNVPIKHDAAANIKPDRANTSDRVDGIVALVMAVDREMVQQVGDEEAAVPGSLSRHLGVDRPYLSQCLIHRPQQRVGIKGFLESPCSP